MLKRCTSSFVAFFDGVPVAVSVGDIVDDGDKLYEASPDSYEDVKVTRFAPVEGSTGRTRSPVEEVETATAAPGEKRTLSTPTPTPASASKFRSKRDDNRSS
jgi:hypothetical protein